MKFSYLAVLAFASVVLGQETFVSQLSPNKCMDLNGGGSSAGNNAVIYNCDGTSTQEWSPDRGNPPAVHSTPRTYYCLDGSDAPAPGVNVTIESCNFRRASQHFLVPRGSGQISLVGTFPELCIHAPNIINWTPLVLEVCQQGDPHQIWHAPARGASAGHASDGHASDGHASAGHGTGYGDY